MSLLNLQIIVGIVMFILFYFSIMHVIRSVAKQAEEELKEENEPETIKYKPDPKNHLNADEYVVVPKKDWEYYKKHYNIKIKHTFKNREEYDAFYEENDELADFIKRKNDDN